MIFLMLLVLSLSFQSFAIDFKSASKSEQDAVNRALKKFDLELDHAPKKKHIGKIYVESENPFLPDDGKFFTFFNLFHVTTRESGIRREILLKPGDQYKSVVVRESEDLLRNLPMRSLVVIVAVRNKDTDIEKVDLLVVTRDTWSLRLETDFLLTGTTVNRFSIAVGEYNIAGFSKAVVADFTLLQNIYDTGLTYIDPRLFGSRHRLTLAQGIIIGRQSSDVAGYRGNLKLELPLYSQREKWGYKVTLDYVKKPIADYIGNDIRTYDAPETDQIDGIKREYNWFGLNGEARATRSFGATLKNNIHFGYGINVYRPSLGSDFGFIGPAKDAFIRDVLPINEIESFVRFGHDFFINKYVTLYDYNTYQLAEVIRLGPTVSTKLDLGSQIILFSDYNFIRPLVTFSYLLSPMRSSLLNFQLSGTARYDGTLRDKIGTFKVGIVSPKIYEMVRIVASGVFSIQRDNRLKTFYTLGGDSGLRGITSAEFIGNNLFRANLEARSRSFPVWVFHLGGAIFYDVGQAFDNFEEFHPVHSVGLGLRILLLQANRQVIRVDYGFAVSEPITNYLNGFSIGFGQAF